MPNYQKMQISHLQPGKNALIRYRFEHINKYITSMTKSIHVVPNPDGGWAAKRSNADRASKLTDTKKEAEDYARKVAQNQGAELFIHGKNGQIQRKDSHGNDDFPPRG
jgi:hypothetical protein